jgi:hypothetical protein
MSTLFPTGVPEDLDRSSAAAKDRWLNIFIQLTQSQRFLSFIEKNFKIVDSIDHENKRIDTMVIETPVAYGPELELSQIAAIRKAIGKRKDGNKVTEEILKILGNEDAPQIEVVSSIKL